MGSRASLLSSLTLSLLFSMVIFPAAMNAQVIPFESGGLMYKALTRGGVTIMFAPLSLKIQNYAVLQIAISNGSPVAWTVKPEDFRFEPDSGAGIEALPARTVVQRLLNKAGRSDISRLVTAYESTLYGNTEIHSTNGYESRRQDAMAINGGRLRAAAAASAICLEVTKLAPGQSTDGAVFYPNGGKPLGTGRLIVHAAAEDFVFPVDALPAPHSGH
jgi:hypothetical protein